MAEDNKEKQNIPNSALDVHPPSTLGNKNESGGMKEKHSKSLLIWSVVGIVFIAAISGAYFFIYEPKTNIESAIKGNLKEDMTAGNKEIINKAPAKNITEKKEEVKRNEAEVVTEETIDNYDAVDVYLDLKDYEKLDKLWPCDVFTPVNYEKTDGLEDYDKNLNIKYRLAELYTKDGNAVQIPDNIIDSIISEGNRKEIKLNISGQIVVIKLLEVHENIKDNTKEFCIDESVCLNIEECCMEMDDWIKVSINGFESIIYREEFKQYTFDNGLVFSLSPVDMDVDFCMKVNELPGNKVILGEDDIYDYIHKPKKQLYYVEPSSLDIDVYPGVEETFELVFNRRYMDEDLNVILKPEKWLSVDNEEIIFKGYNILKPINVKVLVPETINIAGKYSTKINVEGSSGKYEWNTSVNINLNVIVNDIDTDKDGLLDKEEEIYGTDILKADTDGDGFSDGDEVKNGYNPIGDGKINM